LSGNLSHQIEHHLFADVPANRYAEMAVEVKRIAGEYGQHYNTGTFARQLASVVKRIVRYALPNTTPGGRTVDLLGEGVGRSPRSRASRRHSAGESADASCRPPLMRTLLSLFSIQGQPVFPR